MHKASSGLIRVRDASEEAQRLRRDLDNYERKHDGLSSDRLIEAFTIDGALVETDEFHAWSSTYASWRILVA